ncbi:MAG: VOC family protein [Candidatus Binatia bacterium]
MPVMSLGHAVLKVRKLERSLEFYRDVLGFKEVARLGEKMVFLSAGKDHHDLALMEAGPGAPAPEADAIGLAHLAFKVGDSLAELQQMKQKFEQAGYSIVGISDHKVSKSVYLLDPDGLGVEVYIDENPSIWKEDPTSVATVRPFHLD